MAPSFIAIAGVDHFSRPIDYMHPKLEMGILYSNVHSHNGFMADQHKTRYLPFELYSHFQHPNMAIHICGKLADAIRSTDTATEIRAVTHLTKLLRSSPIRFERVQLNIMADNEYLVNRENRVGLRALADVLENDGMRLILQTNATDMDLLNTLPQNIDILFDASAGRGLPIEEIPPFQGVNRVGIAGGINPFNIAALIEKIEQSDLSTPSYYLDLESGARTEDILSPHLVKTMLDAVYG